MESEGVRRRASVPLIRCADGAALVEAALVLPILLLIVFALAELSLYFWTQSRVEKAVQLGLRRAVVADPVAIGPGLYPADSQIWWEDLPPGLRCFPSGSGPSPCPGFAVTCDIGAGCRCAGGCRFVLDRTRLTPILQAMQAVLPNLKAENVRITYATNGFGYVGRPLPVPVDVTLSIIGLSYPTLFLGDVFGSALPLRAQARRPSEDLVTR